MDMHDIQSVHMYNRGLLLESKKSFSRHFTFFLDNSHPQSVTHSCHHNVKHVITLTWTQIIFSNLEFFFSLLSWFRVQWVPVVHLVPLERTERM